MAQPVGLRVALKKMVIRCQPIMEAAGIAAEHLAGCFGAHGRSWPLATVRSTMAVGGSTCSSRPLRVAGSFASLTERSEALPDLRWSVRSECAA
jgi:hypothetical protein